MPSAGFSHFYPSTKKWTHGHRRCVNALSGLFSFLLTQCHFSLEKRMCVNALSGLFSFLRYISARILFTMTCVNALSGLFSFLRLYIRRNEKWRKWVSMPSAGSSHFYGYWWYSLFLITTGVSMPSAGSSHFYLMHRLISIRSNVCQCPQRALLISTVPSGNPCKYWLPSLIFAGICQTILKTAVFCNFLVCS